MSAPAGASCSGSAPPGTNASIGARRCTLAERFERLEETLRICLQMWSEDDGAFEGRHYRLARPSASPAPCPSRFAGPHRGSGERKTLRLVARYGDACNLFATSADEIAHKLDVLACWSWSRGPRPGHGPADDPGGARPLRRPRRVLGDMDAYAKLGIDEVALMPSGDPVAYVERTGSEIVLFAGARRQRVNAPDPAARERVHTAAALFYEHGSTRWAST